MLAIVSERHIEDRNLAARLAAQAGFIGAAVAHGFKRVRDFNGADRDGVSGHSVHVVNGIRENAAIAFLTAEVRRRPNLTIRGDVTIDRVLFDGTAATGVVARHSRTAAFSLGSARVTGKQLPAPSLQVRLTR